MYALVVTNFIGGLAMIPNLCIRVQKMAKTCQMTRDVYSPLHTSSQCLLIYNAHNSIVAVVILSRLSLFINED